MSGLLSEVFNPYLTEDEKAIRDRGLYTGLLNAGSALTAASAPGGNTNPGALFSQAAQGFVGGNMAGRQQAQQQQDITGMLSSISDPALKMAARANPAAFSKQLIEAKLRAQKPQAGQWVYNNQTGQHAFMTPQQISAAPPGTLSPKAPVAQKPEKPQITEGADGFKYFVNGPNAGERVLPNIKKAPDDVDPNKMYRIDLETGEQVLTRKGVDHWHEKWRTRLKPTIEGVREADRKMRIVEKSLNDKTGSGDIAAVNAYQRMIDDGVVRSEDVNLQREAVSLVQQVKAWKDKAVKGELLPQAVRDNMRRVARALTQETMQGYKTQISAWRTVVEDTPGLKWGSVMPDEFNKYFETPAAAPKGKGVPVSSRVGGASSMSNEQLLKGLQLGHQ
tara:strand:+ start:41 stop:1213 length:1173 start_codon:yes stop_codon:yes gene_type:complete